MRRRRFWTVGLMLALVLVLLLTSLLVGHAAEAATFTVNNTNDVDDTKCNSAHCSLREAINAANASPGADTIDFQLPSSDPNCSATTKVCTIMPAGALPTLTDDDTHIDGYTQGDAAPPSATGAAVLPLALSACFVIRRRE